MTLWNLNTQKVESVNKRLKRSLPSSVNFRRNFIGRAHRAVFTVNRGPGKAIEELCDGIGSPVASSSSVSRTLKTEQDRFVYYKTRSKSMKVKIQKKKKRDYLYKLYDCKVDEEIYVKDRVMLEKKKCN